MRTIHLTGIPLLSLMLMLAFACDKQSSTRSDVETTAAGSDTDEEESPEQLAKDNSEQAEADLRMSQRGTDDDGERVWMQDGRAFFDFEKYKNNRTFEMPTKWARQFVNDAYTAGAERVWVVQISELELEGTKLNVSDNLVVVLPDDPTKRKTVFLLYNKEMSESGEPALKDIGQRYISIIAD